MTRPEFDSIMNSIVFDFCFIFGVEIFGLIAFGTNQEKGDENAGSLYGYFAFPLIPVILIALGLIQFTKAYISNKNAWLSLLTPAPLAIIAIWIKPTFQYILLSCLLLIIFYRISKYFILKISNEKK